MHWYSGRKRFSTHLVFHRSCAALTLILAVSAVKGGSGGFVVAAAGDEDVDAIPVLLECEMSSVGGPADRCLIAFVQDLEGKHIH
jgi:hypothetical protein